MMIDYSWVSWFGELVGKIADNGKDYLIGKANAVNWGRDRDKVPLLQHGNGNIDPLSFIYFLAQRITAKQFKPVFQSVHKEFDITSKLPTNLRIIPIPPPNAQALFHLGKGTYRPELFWHLFERSAREAPQIDSGDFDPALQVKNVGIKKLTQTLFIVNPCYFLPADESNKALPQPEFQQDVRDYDEYVARMDAIKRMFPGCEPYEINTFLDTQRRSKTRLITPETQFFHINSDVKVHGPDHWEETKELPEGTKTFKEHNCVYIGDERKDDPRSKDDRPPRDRLSRDVAEPKRGDIIFVRFRSTEGRAIGVVEQNAYRPSGWSPEKNIAVHWINKKSGHIDEGLGHVSFRKIQQGTGTDNKIRNAEAYKDTFHLIEHWQNGNEAETGQSQSDSETESQAKKMTQKEDRSISPSLNTILFGPPGTGKTWETASHSVAIIDGKNPSDLAKREVRESVKRRFEELKEQERVEFVTFHQSYAYEDFIEGIRPDLKTGELTYKLHEGIFKRICQRACKDPDNKYVLIIDEINRGNIAKIFGELITLIEPSKRLGNEDEAKATLPYSPDPFGVPPNLYILGTMNTADRGIALLDTALRRRFHFVERMPNPELVEKNIECVDGQALLKAINRRIRAKLDREHQIGHTYFMGKTSIKELADAFQHQIMPLLQECFYDDWEKIRFVLNENPFVKEEPSPAGDGDSERPLLEVLPHDDEQWRQAESYQKIYAAD